MDFYRRSTMAHLALMCRLGRAQVFVVVVAAAVHVGAGRNGVGLLMEGRDRGGRGKSY